MIKKRFIVILLLLIFAIFSIFNKSVITNLTLPIKQLINSQNGENGDNTSTLAIGYDEENGSDFYTIVSDLVDPSFITSIEYGEEVPNNGTVTVSTADSGKQTVAWVEVSDITGPDENEDYYTLYYYSEAETIYFNEDCYYMFSGFSNLKTIDISKIDTSKVTNMSSMFADDGALEELDLSTFDTSKVTNMSMMFSNCASLTELDLSSFDTSIVTDMSSMFAGCSELTTLNLSSFDTSNVTNMDMSSMFAGCEKISMQLGLYFKENVITGSTFSQIVDGAATDNSSKITFFSSIEYEELTDEVEAAQLAGSNVEYITVPNDISSSDFSLSLQDNTAITYNGQEKKPKVNLTYTYYAGGLANNLVLKEGRDFTVAYSNNINASENANITVTGTNSYSGEKSMKFTIKPVNIKAAGIAKQFKVTVVDESEIYYNGEPQEPEVIVTYNDGTLEEDIVLEQYDANTGLGDYTITYSNNDKAGTGNIKITGKGNYQNSYSATFTIKPKSISVCTLEQEYDELIYDGTAKNPGITLKDGGVILDESNYVVKYYIGEDEYEEVKNVAEVKVVVTGSANGNYDPNSKLTTTFKILPRSIEIKPEDKEKVYDGAALTSNVAKVVPSENENEGLVEGHVVEITTNGTITNVGEITNNAITETIIKDEEEKDVTSNYTITTAEGSLKITQKEFNEEDFSITLKNNTYVYDGTAKTPEIDKVMFGEIELSSETDYENVTYSNNTNAGTDATVTITGKGNYKGTLSTTFAITPKKIEVPTLETTEFIYSGSLITAIEGNEEDEYTLSGNSATNVGNNTIEISLKDKNNTIWQDTENTENKTIEWKINPKEVELEWENLEFTYNGEKHIASAKVKDESKVEGETINLNVKVIKDEEEIDAINAGTYTAVATITSVEGGNAKVENYKLKNATQEFEIKKAPMSGEAKVTGEVVFNKKLTAEVENLTPTDAILTYQWYRNGTNSTEGGAVINGATEKDYTIGSGLIGQYIYVVVTATKDNYVETTFTNKADGPVSKATPEITLSEESGSVNYNEAKVFTIKSNVNGRIAVTSSKFDNISVIEGNGINLIANVESNITYKGKMATSDEVSINVVFTPTDTINYVTTTKVYKATVNKINANTTVTISGTPVYGETLTANESTTNGEGAKTYKWWYVDSLDNLENKKIIEGATENTYKIDTGLVGKYIGVSLTIGESTNYLEGTTDSTTQNPVSAKAITASGITASLKETTYTYNGKEIKPEVKEVKDGEKVLVNEEDYTVSYSENVNAGEGKVIITGKGDYSGNRELAFTINQKEVELEWKDLEFTYNGEKHIASAIVKDESKIEGETINLNVKVIKDEEEIDAINAGTYTAVATITSVEGGNAKVENYKLKNATQEFEIKKASMSGEAKVTGDVIFNKKLTAEVENLTPTDAQLTYKWYSNENNSTENGAEITGATEKDYTIGAGLVGKYIYVVVTATKDNYVETTFANKADGPVSKATPEITLSEENGSVNYNEEKNFTVTSSVEGTIEVTSGNEEYVTITDGNGKKLTENKEESIKYRGVQATSTAQTVTVAFTPTDTENYNNVTKTYSVVVAKVAATSSVEIEGTPKYDETLTAKVTTNSNGEKTYKWWYVDSAENLDNKTQIEGATGETYKIGTGLIGKFIGVSVTIGESTNYSEGTIEKVTETQVATKAITSEGITASLEKDSYNYDEKKKEPSVKEVKDGEKVLVNNEDYVVSYGENINVGEGKVIISGKGNYSGEKEVTFEIKAQGPFTVKFDANTGTGEMENIEVSWSDKETEKIPENKFVKENYKFVEWNTKQDGTGKSFGKEELRVNIAKAILGIEEDNTNNNTVGNSLDSETTGENDNSNTTSDNTTTTTNDTDTNENTTTTEDENVYTLYAQWNVTLEVGEGTESYVESITSNTTIEEIKKNIETNGNIEIYKGEEKLEGENIKIGTGMKIKISLEDQKVEFEAIVIGDATGDGTADLQDMIRINNYRLYGTTTNFDKIYQKASDVNNDGNIDLTDMIRINNYRLYGTELK